MSEATFSPVAYQMSPRFSIGLPQVRQTPKSVAFCGWRMKSRNDMSAHHDAHGRQFDLRGFGREHHLPLDGRSGVDEPDHTS